jgi:hypothetical protein
MATAYSGPAPKHLRIVGVLSLLWNGFGGYDYVMTHTGGPEYFESMGLDAAAYAWFQALPGWSIAAWAAGVWGSVIGAILLLMRSRHAATAFLVSLLGALVSFGYQFSTERPASLDGGAAVIMPIVILIVIVLQWYYARRQAAAGVLR